MERDFARPDRVVRIQKIKDQLFTWTIFDNGRAVVGVCVHDYAPCDCDRLTENWLESQIGKIEVP